MEKLIDKAYYHYNNALDLVENNEILVAKQELKMALSLYQKDIDILNLMGVCEYYLCNFEDAYKYWYKSRSIVEYKNDAKEYIDFLASDDFENLITNYNKAIDYVSQENYNDAILILEEIVSVYTELIEPIEIIIMCYIKLDKKKEATKYIEMLLEKDKSNIYYLQYKDMIKNTHDYKTKDSNIRKYIVVFGVAVIFIVAMFINILKNEKVSYKEELLNIDSQYESLLEEYSKVKKINEKLNNKIEILNLDSSESKFNIFNTYIDEYKKGNYRKALDGFEYLMEEYPESEYLRSEAIYFAAKCTMLLEEYDKSEEYFNLYIQNHRDGNYYDDSLYEYGLMLNELNKIEKSRDVLNRLVNEEPNSQFINSKVKSIL